MSERPSFHSQLGASRNRSGTFLCIGLDPHPKSLPELFTGTDSGVYDFCVSIVDATFSRACAFKPNHAFFAALGREDVLAALIEYIHRNYQVPVILDAKRGDIGSTAACYAIEAFERYNADAVTVSPFLGWDTLEPFLEYESRGTFVLCRTSNDDSGWLQKQPKDQPIFEQIATRVAVENNPNIGLVVGATFLSDLIRVTSIAPQSNILIPGVGTQGASVEEVVAGLGSNGVSNFLINVSRGITSQDPSENYLSTVQKKAQEFATAMAVSPS